MTLGTAVSIWADLVSQCHICDPGNSGRWWKVDSIIPANEVRQGNEINLGNIPIMPMTTCNPTTEYGCGPGEVQ